MNPTPEQKRILTRLRTRGNQRRARQDGLDKSVEALRSEIRNADAAGIPKTWIAEACGLGRQTIHEVLRRKR